MRDIKAIEKARELIREFEGLSLKPYFCPAGLNPSWYAQKRVNHLFCVSCIF